MKEVSNGLTNDWVEEAAVMGVIEVLKRYDWFKERFAEMLIEAENFAPDILLLVDYPGFNLRFAKAIRKDHPEHPPHLLHQPASLGVEQTPHPENGQPAR